MCPSPRSAAGRAALRPLRAVGRGGAPLPSLQPLQMHPVLFHRVPARGLGGTQRAVCTDCIIILYDDPHRLHPRPRNIVMLKCIPTSIQGAPTTVRVCQHRTGSS
eukprot:gene3856-biopygen4667